MSEIQDAVQIMLITLRMGEELVKIPVRLAGIAPRAIKTMAAAFQWCMNKELEAGEMPLKKMLRQYPGDQEIFRFPEAKRKEFQKMLKKYRVPYCFLPDLNRKDGMAEILFPVSYTKLVQSAGEKLKGDLISFEEYDQNADPEERENFFQSQRREEERTDPEKQKNLEELYQISDYQANRADRTRIAVEVTPQTMMEDRGREIVVKLPGDNQKYVAIDKEGMYPMKNGNYLMFLSRDRNYSVWDKKTGRRSQRKGNSLTSYYEKSLERMYPSLEEMRKRKALLEELDDRKSGADWEAVKASPERESADWKKPLEFSKEKVFSIDGKLYGGYGEFETPEILQKGKAYVVQIRNDTYMTVPGHVIKSGTALSVPLESGKSYPIKRVEKRAGEKGKQVRQYSLKGEAIRRIYFADTLEQEQTKGRAQTYAAKKAAGISQKGTGKTERENGTAEIKINKKMILAVDGQPYVGYGKPEDPAQIPQGRNYDTRIPYRPDEFVRLTGRVTDQGKSLFCRLDTDRKYEIRNRNGVTVKEMTGAELYKSYEKIMKKGLDRKRQVVRK